MRPKRSFLSFGKSKKRMKIQKLRMAARKRSGVESESEDSVSDSSNLSNSSDHESEAAFIQDALDDDEKRLLAQGFKNLPVFPKENYNLIYSKIETKSKAPGQGPDHRKNREIQKAFKKIHKFIMKKKKEGDNLKQLGGEEVELKLKINPKKLWKQNPSATISIQSHSAKFIADLEDHQALLEEENNVLDNPENSGTLENFKKTKTEFETNMEIEKTNKKFPYVRMTVELQSSSRPKVYWSFNRIFIIPKNKFMEQKVVEVDGEQNSYKAVLTCHNFQPSHSAHFYFIIENFPAVSWSYFNIHVPEIQGPKISGKPFMVYGGETNLCGVKLKDFKLLESDLMFKKDGEEYIPESHEASTSTKHPLLPEAEYAILEIPRGSQLPEAQYTVKITDSTGSREVELNPNVDDTEMKTFITSKPISQFKIYRLKTLPFVKTQFVCVAQYSVPDTEHETDWHLFETNPYKTGFSRFYEQRVRMNADVFASILAFEIDKDPVLLNMIPVPLRPLGFQFRFKVQSNNEESMTIFKFQSKKGDADGITATVKKQEIKETDWREIPMVLALPTVKLSDLDDVVRD